MPPHLPPVPWGTCCALPLAEHSRMWRWLKLMVNHKGTLISLRDCKILMIKKWGEAHKEDLSFFSHTLLHSCVKLDKGTIVKSCSSDVQHCLWICFARKHTMEGENLSAFCFIFSSLPFPMQKLYAFHPHSMAFLVAKFLRLLYCSSIKGPPCCTKNTFAHENKRAPTQTKEKHEN